MSTALIMLLDSGAVVLARREQFDAVETFFNVDDVAARRRHYRAALEVLEQSDVLDWRQAARIWLGITPADLEHFDADWPDFDVVLYGFNAACVDGLATGLPMKVRAGLADQLEVTHEVTDEAVVVTIAHPADYGAKTNDNA